jgi:hypothetical protein
MRRQGRSWEPTGLYGATLLVVQLTAWPAAPPARRPGVISDYIFVTEGLADQRGMNAARL